MQTARVTRISRQQLYDKVKGGGGCNLCGQRISKY